MLFQHIIDPLFLCLEVVSKPAVLKTMVLADIVVVRSKTPSQIEIECHFMALQGRKES